MNAKTLYKEIIKSKFIFEHCWDILRYYPKWLNDIQAKKQTKKCLTSTSSPSIASSSPTNTSINLDEHGNIDTNFVDLERPLGKKSETRKIRERNNDPLVKFLEDMRADKKEEKIRKADIAEKKYLLEKEMVEIEKRKIDLEQLREEEKIIQIDTN
ncbi:hypothetical protein Dsin_017052 [Dipteronia sinensis]|uniref:No apical meristem-associated C-terminal domain-containing protein n=1 Tax=Dipteronia sinensis TaxID=43782 RepID=A0AAE0E625_9ROSI|nr:hypothetical protein Dsin_017052 [Dipteronia sinensis]